MKKKVVSDDFGINYSGFLASADLFVGCGYSLGAFLQPSMAVPLSAMAATLMLMGAVDWRNAQRQFRFEAKLLRSGRRFITFDELFNSDQRGGRKNLRWIGDGFIWGVRHCQSVDDISKREWRETYHRCLAHARKTAYLRSHLQEAIRHPITTARYLRTIDSQILQEPGYLWIHALGDEKPMCLSDKDLEGHMAVFGTTGSGKSRFLEIQIVQAIKEGKTVIVLDPKGDRGLVKSMKLACSKCGRDRDFLFFHLAHPEQSININLLANYSRIDELSSRITDTLPGQGTESQVFIDMGRGTLRTICEGLQILGKKPTFSLLHYYFANRDELAFQVLSAVLPQKYEQKTVEDAIADKKTLQGKYLALKEMYRAKKIDSPEIESVLALAERDEESFLKTNQSIWLLLSSLSHGSLGKKLSPSENSASQSTFFDSRKLIDKNAVLYVGLDALTDSGMAKTLGAMFLSDLAATAGARYDFESSSKPVALFVDEAAELTCEPFTQMLNKSRGAKFSICLASQTISDFVAKVRNRNEALRILANLNNFVALRCNDIDTQRFLTQRTLQSSVYTTTQSHSVSTSASHLIADQGSISERLDEQKTDLIPAPLLSHLPNCEFFGVFVGGHVIKGRVPILVKDKSEYQEDL